MVVGMRNLLLNRRMRRVLLALRDSPVGEYTGHDISCRARLAHGAIYPALARLEGVGWITGRWVDIGPGHLARRRYYRLTTPGAAAARITAARPMARPRVIVALQALPAPI